MNRGCSFFVFILFMVYPISCAFDRSNPMDEGGPNFIPPAIAFNEEFTSVKNQDTIHFDSVTIDLVGNKEQSLFQMKLDTGEWIIDWQPEGMVGIGGLTDGDHTILINTMYRGGEMVVSDTINFHVLTKGFKPEFGKADDTTITSFEGKTLTIIAPASGALPLKYSWLNADSVLSGKNKDLLAFNAFSITDTGSYKCVVSNDYGTDTSRIFILQVRSSTGGLKGIVTDTAEKILKGAMLVLTPSNKQVTTGSDGKFEFTSLTEDTYTLKITLAGYEDKTVDDIEVNDSDVVDLKGVELSWIDTTTYKVTYNGNDNEGGEVPVDSTKYSPNSKVAVLGNTGDLFKKGHTFSKWNTKKDGSGDSFNPADFFTIGENVTLYAHWEVNKHTLSYNGNNSTSGDSPEDKEYDYNEKVTVPDKDSLKRAGYTFVGWNTLQNGEGIAYAAQDTFSMPDSNVVLYAQWKAMTTFKVTYDKNGADSGTVPVDSDNYYEGKEVTVAGNTGNLFRDGYFFAGWNAKADGSGDSYNAGSKFMMPDSAVTLYVKWSTNPTYSIIYRGNTNTGGDVPSSVESDSGDNVTIADSGSLVKTGYTFVEWNSKEDGSGKTYSIGEQVTMGTVDIDLYAQWTKARYTVSYHGNGSTGGTVPPATTHLYQSDVTVSTSEPSRTGHTFQGWNTDSTGSGLDYVGGNRFEMGAGDIDLYAKWSVNKYQVSYNENNSTSGDVPGNAEYDFGTIINVAGKGNLIRTGHTFIEWNTEADGSGDTFGFGDELTVGAENVTLYAQWETNEYTVTFNTLGGNEVDPLLVKYNELVPEPDEPEKTSYVFMEWCKDSECNNKWNLSADVITEDDTLYAKWVIMDVDGNIYTEVNIGEQIWMVENLKTTKYNDGNPIPLVTDSATWYSHITSAFCWYNNDSTTYKNVYGGLYNWYSVNTGKLAPAGWHIPNDNDWSTLVEFLGGQDVAGGKLKQTGTSTWAAPNGGATNESGFTAVPGGRREWRGKFEFIGRFGYWWSSDEYDATEANVRYLDCDFPLVADLRFLKRSAFSVRCIKED